MPAEIVNGWYCGSWFASYKVTGSKGDVYVVSLNGAESPAYCEKENGEPCPAYQYSGADMYCKHIEFVHRNACLANCQWHDPGPNAIKPAEVWGTPSLSEQCVCGLNKVVVRIAV